MPDISMCNATTCPVAARCRRNPASGTKPDTELQSFMEFEPEKGPECSGFWPTVAKEYDFDLTHLHLGRAATESELLGTPVLDNWRVLAVRAEDGSKHFKLQGHASGDGRWPTGSLITTSIIMSISAQRVWARTRNTLYRCGRPHAKIPLIVEIAARPTWDEAWEHACTSMGRHTVSEFIWTTSTTDDGDWGRRRVRAKMIWMEMTNAGRSMIADAWWLLSVDATDASSVKAVYDRMCEIVGDYQTPSISDMIDGWAMTARGETGDVDLTDPVAAAHTLGAPRGENEMPLIVRMAAAPDAIKAALIFLSAVQIPGTLSRPYDVAKLLDPKTRRETARRMLDAYGDGQDDDDLFRGLSLLALRTDDVKGLDQIRLWLHSAFDSIAKDPAEQMVYRAWRELVIAGSLTPQADPDDPVASAQALVRSWGVEALRELMEDDIDIPAVGPRGVGPRPSGVVVLDKVGGTTETSSGKEAQREFKSIVGRRLPLAVATGIDAARSALRSEFPHLWTAIDVMLGDLREGDPVRLRPSILIGPPGGGKSRLVQRIAHHLGVGLHRFDGSGSSDNAFGGTPRRWSSGEHCQPLEAVRRHKIANPIVMVDEIDKAGRSVNNGSLGVALMPFLERETAEKFPDPFVQFDVDLSHVSYILTCNDDTLLPAPLRDRLRVVRIPEPTLDHMIVLARGIVADIARENGGDERWYPALDDGELAIVETLWPGGSVRRLRAIVERILARRESNPRN
ncbi:MAG: ATPase [Bradyrhizobium sp.]|nr:ATPase [Bradyrhizobium sp.]